MKHILSVRWMLAAFAFAAPCQTLAQDIFEFRFSFGAYCG
jgi:hypothetical protein